jgi:hypothetical protein
MVILPLKSFHRLFPSSERQAKNQRELCPEFSHHRPRGGNEIHDSREVDGENELFFRLYRIIFLEDSPRVLFCLLHPHQHHTHTHTTEKTRIYVERCDKQLSTAMCFLNKKEVC